ncbi:hypothetical protein C8J57DRAFT_1527840 [Mycena rebaudengoi]|nr:hypothetical protein C8J57DRAFT_1527840 [Mycena rebaudengoi]
MRAHAAKNCQRTHPTTLRCSRTPAAAYLNPFRQLQSTLAGTPRPRPVHPHRVPALLTHTPHVPPLVLPPACLHRERALSTPAIGTRALAAAALQRENAARTACPHPESAEHSLTHQRVHALVPPAPRPL